MNRSIVNRALEKAAQAEADGDDERAAHWMEVADRAEAVYDRKENNA